MIKLKIGPMMAKRGYSARKLAAEAAISPTTAAALLKAQSNEDINISLTILDKVCHVLKCRPNEIMTFERNK